MQSQIENNQTKDTDLLYQLDGRPSLKVAIPLGLQHVLAMFTSNLAPIMILIGIFSDSLSVENQVNMIQCAMFVSGLTTFIQLYPIKIGKFQIGAGLPIVMGTSFAFVPTIQTIGASYVGSGLPYGGIGGVFGATLLGSLVEVVMGFFYKPLQKFFPPLVVGCVLVTIGLNLLPTGVNYFAGGAGLLASSDPAVVAQFGGPTNLILGFTTFATIIFLQRFGKGLFKISAILIGLIVGYVLANIMGAADLSSVATSSWVSLPIPFLMPWEFTFDAKAIFSFAALFVVSGLETIGNTSGITIAGFNREATAEETSGAILADALGSTTASAFNALPNTAFGQNAGIIAMTKVVNKFCVACGAMVLIICAFLPKIGAIFNAMPSSVLGGALITVFSMILINGIKMIAKAGFSERNVLVLGITFGMGLGMSQIPQATSQLPGIIHFIFEDSVACVCVISILANIIFPPTKEDKEIGKDAMK